MSGDREHDGATSQPSEELGIVDETFIVDDDEILSGMVGKVLLRAGYTLQVAPGVVEAKALLDAGEYAVVLTDKNMDNGQGGAEGGMDLLRYISSHHPSTEVIMMTGYATVETAIEAMRVGAFDDLIKPFDPKELERKIERVLACKSFLNPDRALGTHKILHEHIARLVELGGDSR